MTVIERDKRPAEWSKGEQEAKNVGAGGASYSGVEKTGDGAKKQEGGDPKLMQETHRFGRVEASSFGLIILLLLQWGDACYDTIRYDTQRYRIAHFLPYEANFLTDELLPRGTTPV